MPSKASAGRIRQHCPSQTKKDPAERTPRSPYCLQTSRGFYSAVAFALLLVRATSYHMPSRI